MLFALILAAYTNHAGQVFSVVPVKVEPKYVTLSNEVEILRLPFSTFPEGERRRLAADGGSAQFVPKEIVRAVEGNKKAQRRLQNRLAAELITQEAHDAEQRKTSAVLKRYLDNAEKSGRLLPRERANLSHLTAR